MKTFLRIITPFLFIAAFIGGCALSGIISYPFLEKTSMTPAQQLETIHSNFMVFINNGDDVVMLPSDCLVGSECFAVSKKSWSNYSFLMPKGHEEFFRSKLSAKKNGPPWYNFTIEQISEDRQLIKLHSEGSRTYIDVYYEATDKEIRPIKYLDSNNIEGKQLLAMIFGGLISCVVAYLIYRRFAYSKFTSQKDRVLKKAS